MRFYAFKDTTADKFMNPFPCENDELAVKGAFSVLQDKKKIEYYDKELYFVFDFDSSNACITNNRPVKIDSCVSIVNKFKEMLS